MNFFNRIINKIKKERFSKTFKQFDSSSFFDKTCLIEGKENISVGSNVFVGKDSEIFAYNNHFKRVLNSNIDIGDNVRIQCRARITCAGNITIGNNVLFAPDVFITDHNHGMNPMIEGGYSPQDLIISNVIIEDGCWIGQRCCIMPGVTIGAHSIIGANSVVTKNIPPYSIAVGSPAKVIKVWDFNKSKWVGVNNGR